nr:PREDICTED: aspartic proteinase-like protein 2 isoform X2 [Daucus carota subsp. sativus]
MDLGKKVIFVLVLVVCELGWAKGNVVFEVKHKFGARGERSLSALRAHDHRRHARMLAAIDLPLGGKGRAGDSSLFYTKIGIGTPSKDYHLQVDTGSDILWVNCAGCNNCPKDTKLGIKLATYDPKGSSTGTPVTCDQEFCTDVLKASYSDCSVGRLCEYSITYGDGSSTAGFFVKDSVHFNRASGDFQSTVLNGSVTFGCGAKQSGELGSSDESVDGIIGFGQNNSSLISQLASAKKVKKVFSHCLDGKNGGGIFAIGEVVQPKYASTPLVPDMPHYNVIMKAVEVGGDVLELPTDIFDAGDNRGTIIDSGTTLAYLPDEVLRPMMKKIMARQPDVKLHTLEEQFTCFPYKGNVDDGFPVVTFHFEDSLSLSVYPHDYLFAVDVSILS